MSGQASSSSEYTALSRLPPPPPRSRRGYAWTTVLVGIVWLACLALVGFDFFSVPGVDPVRVGGWYFMISLMIITPAAVVLLVVSWGLVAILRQFGARTWPGILQAAPAVLAILAGLYFLVRWLFSGPPE